MYTCIRLFIQNDLKYWAKYSSKQYVWIVYTFSIKNYDNMKSTFKLSLDEDVIGQDVP